jgi:DNA repair protein RecN (Recombination protein N)
MLRELRIKNLAIIDDLKVAFEDGFNVLTGETGAGKSIIVDSLGLVLGGRAQSDLVRTGEKEAVVQAFFDIEAENFPSGSGVDVSDGLIIRRSVFSSGKSRAYVNDTMVSLQSLAEIGRSLVDIHGQHEHQSLFSVENHRSLLDSFGKLHVERGAVEALYKKVEALKAEKAALQEKIKERAHRIDLLRFQLGEIDAACLKTGEKETLAEERKILFNLARLNELAETAYSLIYGSEGSCREKLSSLISKVKEMSSIDNSVSETLNMLESARPLIEDASVSLRGCRDKYDLEPGRLAEVEERLELIKKLEKKYGEGIGNIIRYRRDAEEEIRLMNSLIHLRRGWKRRKRNCSILQTLCRERGRSLQKNWRNL